MLNNQAIKIHRPRQQHKNQNISKNRYIIKQIHHQNTENYPTRNCQSLQFIKIKQTSKTNHHKNRYMNNQLMHLHQHYQLVPDLYVHNPIQHVKNHIKPKLKTQIYQDNIIVLPKKYERIKARYGKMASQIISRPCRDQHNNSQQLSKMFVKVNDYQKKQKNEKLKLRKYKKISNWNSDYDIAGKLRNQDQANQGDMPSNNLLLKRYPKIIQSRVVKIATGFRGLKNFQVINQERIQQTQLQKQQMKANQKCESTATQKINQKNQQKYSQTQIQRQKQQRQQQHQKQREQEIQKQNQKLKQMIDNQSENDQTRMQCINPLKIKNSYLKAKLTRYNQTLFSKIRVQNQPSISKNSLPSQKQLYQYIKNYQPLYKQIQIQSLLMSSIFQVKLISKNESKQFIEPDSNSNNMLYFGEMISGKYQEFGVLIKQNQIRQGIWDKGYLIKGVIKNEKQIYQGQLQQGLKYGYGQSIYCNGCFYQGRWQNDKKCGSGYFKFSNKQSYVGGWKQDNFDGKGVFKTEYSIYQGQFKNSMKNGNGSQKFTNGESYQGQFKQNLPEGLGVYKWKNGISYEGQFHKGARHGYGVLIVPGVIQYKGNFKDDMPSGMGKAIYNNGDQYYGLFYQGQRSGRGDLINKYKKQFYTGDWISDHLVHQLP